MAYWRFPRYVRVAEKRAKAERKLKQLKKKNPHIRPVRIQGRTIARTWWGKAWNDNLERYADYANRIGRGRSYVRHGAVLDLKIEPGRVDALVQGSAARPYSVDIRIASLPKPTWAKIKTACAGRFDSLQGLLAGKFPRELAEIFTARGKGLFPTPEEIDLNCSCPDWATMCKHVAAVLYGIGARLDEDPALFFKLRKVNMDDLVAETMLDTAGELLEKAAGKPGTGIADADLGDVFGIVMEDRLDFDTPAPPSEPPPESKTRKALKRRPSVKAPKKRKLSTAESKSLVLDAIAGAPRGITVPELQQSTGLATIRVRNIVYGAYREGLIQRIGRGLYGGGVKKSDPKDDVQRVLALIKKSKTGLGVSQIKAKTRIADARVRYALARGHSQGKIKRVARGVYAWSSPRKIPLKATDIVLDHIARSRRGLSIAILGSKTGMEEKKLRNIVFRLFKQGKIARASRGVYIAASK